VHCQLEWSFISPCFAPRTLKKRGNCGKGARRTAPPFGDSNRASCLPLSVSPVSFSASPCHQFFNHAQSQFHYLAWLSRITAGLSTLYWHLSTCTVSTAGARATEQNSAAIGAERLSTPCPWPVGGQRHSGRATGRVTPRRRQGPRAVLLPPGPNEGPSNSNEIKRKYCVAVNNVRWSSER
jgi:hypothetical protein